MVKVFNKVARTFQLENEDGTKKMKIKPMASENIPDEFTGDITFRMAVAAGELMIWQEAKEVDEAQKKAEAAAKKTAEKAAKEEAARKAKEEAAAKKAEE